MFNNDINDLMNDYVSSIKGLSDKKIREVIADCKKICTYLVSINKDLEAMLDYDIVTDFIEDQKLSYSIFTVDRRLTTLYNLLIWCQDNKYIDKNINIKKIQISKDCKRHSMCADKKYIKVLYDYCKILETDDYQIARAKFMVLCVIVCGMKTGTLKSMKVSDLSNSNDMLMLMFRKSEQENITAYLSKRDSYAESIHRYNDSLFLNNIGDTYSTICEDFRKVRYVCGVPASVTFNSIRNSCIRDFRDNINNSELLRGLLDINETRLKNL